MTLYDPMTHLDLLTSFFPWSYGTLVVRTGKAQLPPVAGPPPETQTVRVRKRQSVLEASMILHAPPMRFLSSSIIALASSFMSVRPQVKPLRTGVALLLGHGECPAAGAAIPAPESSNSVKPGRKKLRRAATSATNKF